MVAHLPYVCSTRMTSNDSDFRIGFCSVDGIWWVEWVVCVVAERDGKQTVVIADDLLAPLVYS